MFAVLIWILEFELFGAKLLIVLSFSVIAEYSGFRGANSLPILLMEFGVFEACFTSGFFWLQNRCNSQLLIRCVPRCA